MNKIFRHFSMTSIILLVFILGFRCNPGDELVTGQSIYKVYCVNCHGIDGKLSVNNAIDLSKSRLPLEGRKEIIRNGRLAMTGFSSVLTDAQIDSVAGYTLKLQQETQ